MTEYAIPLTTRVHNPRLRVLNGLKAGKKPVMTFMGLSSVRGGASDGVDRCRRERVAERAHPRALWWIASTAI